MKVSVRQILFCLNSRQRWLWIVVAVIALIALEILGGVLWTNHHLVTAEEAFKGGHWKKARDDLALFLWTHPNHPRARRLMAEALIRDDGLRGKAKVHEALDHLKRVPDQSQESGEARLLEGRLYLLTLLQPAEAERCFRLSIQQAPARLEARTLLWKLFDLTARPELAEEQFWQIYEWTPPTYRTSPLRDWYLSEFAPGAANSELDHLLGFLGPCEQPGVETDKRRLEALIDANPDWVDGYAILARWYHRQRLQRPALELLETAERLPGASQVELCIAVRVVLSIELGEFDQAREAFERWPQPHAGYEYWKAAGLIADQVLQNNQHAGEAYAHAIATTSGKVDWRTQHRLAQCLIRLGRIEPATTILDHARKISSLMDPEQHRRLRHALLTPRDPDTIRQMIDFYQQLNRPREASAWQRAIPAETPNLND